MEKNKVFKKYLLTIDGMKCGMCESHVNDLIRRLTGIKKVKSNRLNGQVEVICLDNVSYESLEKALSGSGYKILSYDSKYVVRTFFGYKNQ